MCCHRVSIASVTTGCSPTPTASETSPPLVNFCITGHSHRSLNPATTALLTASGPPSCAGTAAHRCSSSRLSHERSTSADRRHLRVRHEHPLLTAKTFPVGASSNQADTNAHGRCRGYPAFLHAATANIRILPPEHC